MEYAVSIELRYLIYSALLMLAIWVPYILAHINQVGFVEALSYPDEVLMPDWARWLKRAHYNLVENLAPFAVAVLAAEIIGLHTATTTACAMIFFWARVAHPVAVMARIWGTRTLAFAVGWAATIVYLWVVLTAAV